ncbi:MAG: hypothetical protein OEQ53_06600, partial [Saprospiraceae bacterium]|nr:hypothetical protein [Saprospiraceae bacterium]
MISELKGHWQGVQLDPTKGFQVFAIGRQAAAFLISIILVKSHWSTMEIGAYELWLFFGLVLSFAWLTGALQSFSSLYPPMSEMEKAKFITSTYLNTIAVVGVLAVALALGQQYYVPGLFQLEEVPYLSLALLYLLLHTTSYLSPHILLVRRLHNQFIPYTLIYMIGHVMAVSVPLLLAGGLREVLYGLIVFAILEQVYLLFLVRQHGSWSWSPHLWAKLSRLALPLGL